MSAGHPHLANDETLDQGVLGQQDPHKPIATRRSASKVPTGRLAVWWVLGQVVAGVNVSDLKVGMEMELVIVPLATDSRQSALVITFMLFSAVTLHRVAEYGLLLRAAGQPRDLLMSGLVLLAANTVLAGIGAWRWSMPGSAAGTLAANVIAWCFVLHRVARALGVSFAQAFPWARWATSVASSAIAAGAALAAGSAMRGTVTRVAIEAAAFVGIVILADRTVKAGRIIQPRVSAT